jgi:hypothetical protein
MAVLKSCLLLPFALLFTAAPPHAQPQKDHKKSEKLCAQHPTWSADDCLSVVEHRLFVGMTREMVLAERPLSCLRQTGPKPATNVPRPATKDFCETHRLSRWGRSYNVGNSATYVVSYLVL